VLLSPPLSMAATDAVAFFSKEGPEGTSVREHLAELIHSLLLNKDDNALEKLESLSLGIKAAKVGAPQKATVRTPVGTVPSGAVLTQPHLATSAGVPVPGAESWHKQSKALHKVDPETIASTPFAELPAQMPMFEWAGVGLGKEETYRTYLAMLGLQKQHNLLAVRFFGKVLGTQSDYVVIEGKAPADVHKPPSTVGPVPAEPPGVGLNTCCYFVAPSAADPFVLLEDVTPEQVVAAQTVRKYLTGNLTAPVYCYPAFPGSEAALLRATIARIAAATVVYPAGKVVYDEESEETPKPIKDAEEYAVPDDLTSPESWVHAYGKILKIGRTLNPPKPELAEGEEEPEPTEEPEEETPALEPLAGDLPVMSYPEELQIKTNDDPIAELPAWRFTMYNAAAAAHAVAIAKSERWPGAYAAIAKSGDKHACVYIGYGHETKDTAFTQVAPPPILAESAETEEGEEAALAEENALLKTIDDTKNESANAEGDPEE